MKERKPNYGRRSRGETYKTTETHKGNKKENKTINKMNTKWKKQEGRKGGRKEERKKGERREERERKKKRKTKSTIQINGSKNCKTCEKGTEKHNKLKTKK